MMILTFYFIFLIDLIFDILFIPIMTIFGIVDEKFKIFRTLIGFITLFFLRERLNVFMYRAGLCPALRFTQLNK